jgi:peptidoglycan-associated lipoprotein
MVSIAGDADERGEIVYNLTLSDHRAKATRDALVQLGIPADRIIFATGWGKLYPVCAQADETCWSQNRRAHFTSGTDLQTQTVAKKADAMPIIACATLDCP